MRQLFLTFRTRVRKSFLFGLSELLVDKNNEEREKKNHESLNFSIMTKPYKVSLVFKNEAVDRYGTTLYINSLPSFKAKKFFLSSIFV